jgi:hypothetical protein
MQRRAVVQCYKIIDDEPIVLQNYAYYAFIVVVRSRIAATIGLLVSEPEVSVNGFSPTVLLLRIETFDGFAASFGPEKRPSSSQGVAGFYWFARRKSP